MIPPSHVDVCPEMLAGGKIDLVPDGEGGSVCDRCGASSAIVFETKRRMAEDWTAGGPGFRKPRADEVSNHR